MKQKYFWRKLIGTVILLHVTLITLSIVEVTVYSYVINPNHDKEFYEKHAEQFAPWISYIFGTLFIFLLVRRFLKRFDHQQGLYACVLPLTYTVIDFVLILMMVPNSNLFEPQFLIGATLKFSAAMLAYYFYRTRKGQH